MHGDEFRYSFVPTAIQFGKVYDKFVEKRKTFIVQCFILPTDISVSNAKIIKSVKKAHLIKH